MRSPKRSARTLLLGALSLLPLTASQPAHSQPGSTPAIIAIDVLIEPDAVMANNAKAINTQLRRNYPQGYALDATHLPHITLVQRYIRFKDLEAVKTAVAKVFASQNLSSMQLTATSYITSTWGSTGLLLYNVERTTQLQQLEDKIVAAVQPYAVTGGTAAAFVRSPAEQIDPKTIQWVEDFVPAHSGEKYEPHVTLGLAHPEFLKTLKAAPFASFAFRPASIAIYQLGNLGTAQKNLASWPVN